METGKGWRDVSREIIKYYRGTASDYGRNTMVKNLIDILKIRVLSTDDIADIYRQTNIESDEYLNLSELEYKDFLNACTYKYIDISQVEFPVIKILKKSLFRPRGVYQYRLNAKNTNIQLYFPKSSDIFINIDDFIRICRLIVRIRNNHSVLEIKQFLIDIGLGDVCYSAYIVSLKNESDDINEYDIGDILGNKLKGDFRVLSIRLNE